MKNSFLQNRILPFISITIVMIVFVAIYVPLSIVMWLVRISEKDGFTHKNPIKTQDRIYPSPEFSDDVFDKTFASKPLPKPYNPQTNPLYVPKPATPVFNQNEPFVEVEKSNILMSKTPKKKRYSLRGSDGKFIKKNPLPITRYGVATCERFKGQ